MKVRLPTFVVSDEVRLALAATAGRNGLERRRDVRLFLEHAARVALEEAIRGFRAQRTPPLPFDREEANPS